jgi:hypothetical protein
MSNCRHILAVFVYLDLLSAEICFCLLYKFAKKSYFFSTHFLPYKRLSLAAQQPSLPPQPPIHNLFALSVSPPHRTRSTSHAQCRCARQLRRTYHHEFSFLFFSASLSSVPSILAFPFSLFLLLSFSLVPIFHCESLSLVLALPTYVYLI